MLLLTKQFALSCIRGQLWVGKGLQSRQSLFVVIHLFRKISSGHWAAAEKHMGPQISGQAKDQDFLLCRMNDVCE